MTSTGGSISNFDILHAKAGRGPPPKPAEIYTLLIRERQDIAAFRRERDKALVSAVSKPEGQRDLASNNAIRKQVSDSEIRLAVIGALLEKQFPEYAALAM